MRIISVIAVLVLMSALAAPASAGMVEDCNQRDDPDLKIGGCTAMIRSGEYSGRDLAAAYNNRGNSYGRLGESAQAIKDYDQALRLDPGYALVYRNRGRTYHRLGEYRRAIKNYDQALRIDPGFADAFQNRGVTYESLGDFERAAQDWEQAIRVVGASRATWWQDYMKGKGLYAGAVDGIFGPATRRALLACAIDPAC